MGTTPLATERRWHGTRCAQVVDLLLQGLSNKEIAGDMGIAERTVKAYVHRLINEYNVTGGVKRVKLAVLLYREQLASEANKETE